MSNLNVETSTLPPLNMMLISVFYHIPLVIGYTILLDGFKMGDEVLDQPGLGAIFFGHGSDGEFILDDSHECWVELQMVHLEVFFYESEEVDGRKNWLGACTCSVFTWDAVGVVGKQPSLLRTSWRPQQHGVGNKGSTRKGSWVVAVIVHQFEEPYVILCSPACSCVYNDEDKFWACTKNAHQG